MSDDLTPEPPEIDLVGREREELAQRLSASLNEQADRFEPSPDSYVRLQQEVARAGHGGARLTSPRVLAMAAAMVVLVGAGAYLFSRTTSQNIETATPETTIAVSTTTPTTAATDLPTTTTVEPATTTSTEPVTDGLVAGPRRPTRQEAAEDFLALIRVPYAAVEVDGDLAHVISYDPDGEVGDRVSTLELAPVRMADGSAGFAVMSAASGAAVIDWPAPGQLVEAPSSTEVTVTGQGTGFEASISVRLISAFDGTLLDQRATTAGNFGELGPYQVELMLTGRDHGWVVAESGIGAGGTPPFSAVPFEWDAGPDPTVYVVSHIPVDDVDGGLNLRNLPGVDEGEVLETLPAGTSGIRRRGRVPAFVGDEVWWAVTIEGGREGWVNSRFLAQTGELTTEELVAVAESFVSGVRSDGFTGVASIPWSTRKPVQFGWYGGLEQFDAATLADPEFWRNSREWMVPEATYSSPIETASPRTFLGLADDLEYTASPDIDQPAWSQGLVIIAVESELNGLSYVTINAAGDDFDTEDRTVNLFVEPTAAGPRIVGVGVWIWIP